MRVIIFGTGKLYEINKPKFKHMDIVALLDNDPGKQGTYIDGIEVLSPQQLKRCRYDYILLVSKHYKEMYRQLAQMGIPRECILDREYQGIFSEMRKMELYRKNLQCTPKAKILLVTHDLELTGAPIVLSHMASVLQEAGYGITLYSDKKGSLLYEYIEKGISVTVFEDFQFSQEEIELYFSEFDFIVANTVTLYQLVRKLGRLPIPVIWWLHEEDNIYRELEIKPEDLETGDMVFTYGVSSRAEDSYLRFSGGRKIGRLTYGIAEGDICRTPEKGSKKTVFAVIGTVDSRKAQDVFVKAVEENWTKWKDTAEFWLIGRIPEDVQNQYEALGCIRIFGELDHEELMEVYPEIDVVVCPSRNDPLPVVLAEGMMYKKVCIASDMTGTAEYIKHCENGLLCRAGDVKSLADSMQWALDHKSEWEGIGEKAYQVYKEAFSMGQFRNNVLQIVETHRKKKAEELLSVIIPVYNKRPYLPQCIESVLNQSYTNIDLILQDDGSDDGSYEVCMSYAKDGRVRVIRQKNQGAAAARRKGAEEARGEYVVFIDADDYVDTDYFEKLMGEADKGLDLVTSGCYFGEASDQPVYDLLEAGVYRSQEQLDYIIDNMILYRCGNGRGLTPYMVNKLFRTELARQVFREVNTNIFWGEDSEFVYRYVLACKAIKISRLCGYYYCDRTDSIVHTVHTNYLANLNEAYLSLREVFERHRRKEKLLMQLELWMSMEMRNAFRIMGFQKITKLQINYVFPFYEEMQGKCIVIYGAGNVGKDYYWQLRNREDIDIAGWTDKDAVSYQKEGYPLILASDMELIDYDYIVLAVMSETVSGKITEELRDMGVPKEKICWRKPLCI